MTGNDDASTPDPAPPARPSFLDRRGPACPVCGHVDTKVVHFPHLSEPYPGCVPWPAHDKFFCDACVYLWCDRFADLDLASYGRAYVHANTEAQRIPNERMAASPLLLDMLLAWTDGQRFLDYGIGYNTPYVEEVRALGIDLWGCDISATVPYGGHIVRLPESFAILGEASFDGIFSQDVVEHFHAPAQDLAGVGSLLKPGGLLLASTPILDQLWQGTEPITRHIWLWSPWHVSVCSTRSMSLLAQQAQLAYIDTVAVPTAEGQAFLLQRPAEAAEPAVDVMREGSDKTRRLRSALGSYIVQRDWPGKARI